MHRKLNLLRTKHKKWIRHELSRRRQEILPDRHTGISRHRPQLLERSLLPRHRPQRRSRPGFSVFGHETSVRFQANFYNAFNKTNLQPILFGTQNATVESTLFGLSPAADAGRVIDFFLRVDF